ncbi:hypothetical protein O181_047178 [Austropuccinia psidii MF-1]|uniref:Uncharacterized protein n=1 Tax=Austropuccinia psidii MF-1 TaxID=1389203 RepID=A0A9Q3DVI5_9BASI|nr:hypothetical protein [Austropuccinia psidii MF-1]
MCRPASIFFALNLELRSSTVSLVLFAFSVSSPPASHCTVLQPESFGKQPVGYTLYNYFFRLNNLIQPPLSVSRTSSSCHDASRHVLYDDGINDPQDGTIRSHSFHLFMRFSYQLALPLFCIQAIITAHIKYTQGFLSKPLGGLPMPYIFWPEKDQGLILPIYLMQAICWSAETTVHVEELFFWLFLLSLSPTSSGWFKSIYFKSFCFFVIPIFVTSIGIVVGMQEDVLRMEAVLYSFNCILNLILTVLFLWVLYRYPIWLKSLKVSGAPPDLIIRLYGIGELNKVKTAFRFLFIVPLAVLSFDGLSKTQPLNHIMWVVDLLLLSALIGEFVQCLATMAIFFPRNYVKECGFRAGQEVGRLQSNQSESKSYSSKGIYQETNQSGETSSTLTPSGVPLAILQYRSPIEIMQMNMNTKKKSQISATTTKRIEIESMEC